MIRATPCTWGCGHLLDPALQSPRRAFRRRQRGPTRNRARYVEPRHPNEPAARPAFLPIPAVHADLTATVPTRLLPLMREAWRQVDAWATDQQMDRIWTLMTCFRVRPFMPL